LRRILQFIREKLIFALNRLEQLSFPDHRQSFMAGFFLSVHFSFFAKFGVTGPKLAVARQEKL